MSIQVTFSYEIMPITTTTTNALLSIKTPTMSSIINKQSQYTIDSHNNFFIGQDNTKKITFSKKYGYNGCILVLPSIETHSIHNLIKEEFQQYYKNQQQHDALKKKEKKKVKLFNNLLSIIIPNQWVLLLKITFLLLYNFVNKAYN